MWGLAFKPNTEDIRESPSLVIFRELQEKGAEIVAYDPEAMPSVQAYTDLKLSYADNAYDTLDGADALLIVTEWGEFRTPDFERIKTSLRQPVIFDGRNVYDRETLEDFGFEYLSIGRQPVKTAETMAAE